MKLKTSKPSAVFLSLSLVLSSLGPSAPLFAAVTRGAAAASKPGTPLRAVSLSPALNAPAKIGFAPVQSLKTPGLVPSLIPAAAAPAPQAAPAVKNGSFIALQAYAASADRQAPAARDTLLGRITKAVAAGLSWNNVFDSSARGPAPGAVMGVRRLPPADPGKYNLPKDLVLDAPPAAPDHRKVPTVTINEFNVPGAKTTGSIFDVGPRVLKADAANVDDVERALREMIDLDAAKYGVTSAELDKVHVVRVEGKGHQADTIWALFHQVKEGKRADGSPDRIPVHGAQLSFTVKIIEDKPVLMAAQANLYPDVSVNANQTKTDDELRAVAETRLGREVEPKGRKIIYSRGSWHAANLYSVSGIPFIIAVDIATEEVFVWDARLGAQEDEKQAEKSLLALILGRGEVNDTRKNGVPNLVALPMPELNITMGDGRAVTTNTEGQLVVQSPDGKEMAFSSALEGTWARVKDDQGRTLVLHGTAKPGNGDNFVYNPKDAEEWIFNLINIFQGVNRAHNWLYPRFPDKRLLRPIDANGNINEECNAYYTPGNPSLNFFHSSANCSDTGRPGIIAHEFGHFWDDMIGGIVNGGLSEGWGDILSMYLYNSPIIGDGFLKNLKPGTMGDIVFGLMGRLPVVGDKIGDALRDSWIRHGENKHQYDANDEVHDQGQVWMGFAWKLRKALIAALGEAAGAALAEILVIPTMYAKATDIPAAMAQVLLNDMDKKGHMPHEAAIRAAAKVHGVELPKNPGMIMSLWNQASSPLSQVSLQGFAYAHPAAAPGIESLEETAGLAGRDIEPGAAVKARIPFSAGALVRAQVRREIEKYCDYHGLKYELKEYRSLFESDFLLIVEGPYKTISYLVEQLKRMSEAESVVPSKPQPPRQAPPSPPMGRASLASPAQRSDSGSISGEELAQFLEVVSQLSSPLEINEAIEQRYDKWESRLTWDQVKTLLYALRSTRFYDAHDEMYTRDRIAKSYLMAHIGRLSPIIAGEIACNQNSPLETNALIEEYFNRNLVRLTWADVKVLLSLLRRTNYSDAHDEMYTRDRIIHTWEANRH